MLARFLPVLALLLSGCHPGPMVSPNINDRSPPDLRLYVYYDASHFDSVVKPDQTFSFAPNRCLYVSNPFHVVATATDVDGGISYLSLGSPDLVPLATTIVAKPPPDSPTQTLDQTSPPVTYPNPGMFPGSRTAEATYYTGAPGRVFYRANLEADFDFGGNTVADLNTSARNTSVSASSSSIDGYFVRPADAAHAPGSACTPPA